MLKGITEHFFGVDNKIAEDKITLLYATGQMKESLERIRQKHKIAIEDIDGTDLCPCPESDDISIFTASRWYNSLTESEERTLIGDSIRELQDMGLSPILLENYLMAAKYDTPVKTSLMPTSFFPTVYMLNDNFGPLSLTTKDKDFLKLYFKVAVLGIDPLGKIPNDKKAAWETFENFVNKGKNKNRRIRNLKLKLAVLENRAPVEYVNDHSYYEKKKIKPAPDKEIIAELFADTDDGDISFETDRKRVQCLRKHRERIKKELKKDKKSR